MADITMCFNRECPNFNNCYRAQAKASMCQAYMVFKYDDTGKCEYFRPIEKDEVE